MHLSASNKKIIAVCFWWVNIWNIEVTNFIFWLEFKVLECRLFRLKHLASVKGLHIALAIMVVQGRLDLIKSHPEILHRYFLLLE